MAAALFVELLYVRDTQVAYWSISGQDWKESDRFLKILSREIS